MLSSKNSDMRLVIGGRNLLTKKLLHPKLVIVNHSIRSLDYYPFAFVANSAFGSVYLVHRALSLVLVTRLALAYSAVTGH